MSYTIPPSLDAVDPLVRRLDAELRDHLDPEVLFRAMLSVTEVLTNIVQHCQPRTPGAVIEVRLARNEAGATITVFEPEGAAPFDPRQAAGDPAGAEALAENGRGIGLIQACTDHIDYGAVAGRHRLCLRFEPRDAAAHAAPEADQNRP